MGLKKLMTCQERFKAFEKDLEKCLDPETLQQMGKKEEVRDISGVYKVVKTALNNDFQNLTPSLQVLEDFCENVIQNNNVRTDWRESDWKNLSDLIKRVVIGKENPIDVLKNIVESLVSEVSAIALPEIDAFSEKSPEERAWDASFSRIQNELKDEFILSKNWSLRLVDNRNKSKRSFKCPFLDELMDYFSKILDNLTQDDIKPENETTDLKRHINDSLRDKFIKDIAEKNAAVEILMRNAPESIWAVKCLQVGICTFEWKKRRLIQK